MHKPAAPRDQIRLCICALACSGERDPKTAQQAGRQALGAEDSSEDLFDFLKVDRQAWFDKNRNMQARRAFADWGATQMHCRICRCRRLYDQKAASVCFGAWLVAIANVSLIDLVEMSKDGRKAVSGRGARALSERAWFSAVGCM